MQHGARPRRRQGRRSYLLEVILAAAASGVVGMWYGRSLSGYEFSTLAARVDDGCYRQLQAAEDDLNDTAGAHKAVAQDRW